MKALKVTKMMVGMLALSSMLVACGKKNDDPQPEPVNPYNYAVAGNWVGTSCSNCSFTNGDLLIKTISFGSGSSVRLELDWIADRAQIASVSQSLSTTFGPGSVEKVPHAFNGPVAATGKLIVNSQVCGLPLGEFAVRTTQMGMWGTGTGTIYNWTGGVVTGARIEATSLINPNYRASFIINKGTMVNPSTINRSTLNGMGIDMVVESTNGQPCNTQISLNEV